MARRIVERFDPDKIILFGSHAHGTARADSDVDLLVVMHYAGPKSQVQSAIRVALNDFRVAKDIIVVSPEEFEWRSLVPGTVERPAALEGKTLHARP